MRAPSEPAIRLRLVSERLTARELIERRARQDVDEFNASPKEFFRGLVKPTDAEEALDGFRVLKRARVDADRQVESALRALTSNGFLLLVDDRQVESPDEAITLRESSRVTFVKLVPLIGG
jgi:hypothetical protein